MARAFGLVALLVPLAAAGWLISAQLRETERDPPPTVTAVAATAASINLQQAASALESAKGLGGTYAGVDVSGFGVTVVRADTAAYCIEAGGLHVAGSGDTPAGGPC